MNKRWQKNPTFNVRFPLETHRFTITVLTRVIADIYDSTFVISQKVWFLMNIGKIYTTLYIIFSLILGFYFLRLLLINEKNPTLYLSSSCFLWHFNWKKIWVWGKWINQNSMLYFNCKNITLKYNNIQGIFLTFMLLFILFINRNVSWWTDVR